MALTKVSGDFIQDGSITQGHLHASHGITTSDIGEGSNLYFTTARVDSRIGDLSTSDLSEGTNLYYTDARADARIALQVGSNLDLSSKSTSDLSEGTNLYYTQARFNTAFAAKSTSDLSEGTNLYYTDARADARIAAASTSDLSEGTNLYYTDARVGSYLTTNSYATQSYVNTQVSNLVDSAPSTLDTLNELAAALGDDANFSTTVTNSIATKMPLAGGTFTGNVAISGTNHLELFGFLYTRSTLRVLNAAGNGWHNWATRGGGKYDLNVNNITVAAITASGNVTASSGTGHFSVVNSSAYQLNGTYVMDSSRNLVNIANITASGNVTGANLNISNWDTAYGWGNHASAGYLTSYTETDTLATVTARGASTSTAVTFAKATFNTSSTGLPRQITIKEDGDTENSMGSYPGAWTSALNIQSNDASTYLWLSPLTSNIPRIQTNYGQLDFYTGSNTNRALHLSGTSARSEIFYDLNNTGYYANPASTSKFAILEINNGTTGNQKIEFKDASTSGYGALRFFYNNSEQNTIHVFGSTWSSNFEGGSRGAINLSGHTGVTFGAWNSPGAWVYNSGQAQFQNSVRSPIFYDSGNTGRYIDAASTSRINRLEIENTSNQDTPTAYMQIGSDGFIFGGNNSGYEINSAQISAGYHTANSLNFVGMGTTSTVRRMDFWAEGGFFVSGNIYDKDNTAYYVDPAGTSVLNRVEIDDDLDVRAQVGTWITSNVMSDAIGWNTNYGVYIGSNVGGTHYLRGNGTFTTGGSTYNLWHQGNDGSGSGLDADTLDGQHASAFASASHTHDDRYYTESEMQTFFNRGYINNHSATNAAAGWYTIATNTGDRALGEFQIWDTASSDHQSVLFSASHHFGTDTSNDITVLANSRYSGTNFRYIRIKENGTYDGAVLQVYIDGGSNTVYAAIVGGNAQESGWVLKDWIADGTDPGDVSSYNSMTERTKVDLDLTINGGITTTGPIYSGGQTTQYRVLNTSDEGSGNGLDADTLDGVQGSNFLRSNVADTNSVSITAPIYYDTNTAYYLDAGGTSNLVSTFADAFLGRVTTSGDGQSNYPFRLASDYSAWMMTAASNTWGLFWAGNSGARYGTNGNGGPGNIWSNSANPNEFAFVGSDTTLWTVHGTSGNSWQAGYGTAAGSFRAPIFYDSIDTNSYFDSGGVVLRGSSPTIYFRDTNHNSAMIHVNSNIFYVLRGSNDTTSWSQVGGRWPLEINLTTNNALFGASVTAIGNLSASGGYLYLSSGNSIFSPSGGVIKTASNFYAERFYDYDDTTRYVDVNSTSYIATLHTSGTIQAGNSGTGNIYLGNTGVSGSGNHFRFHTNNSHTYFDGNCGDIHWRQGNSTRFYFYMTTANMTINGTLTQYSDERLKQNVVTIDNALNKVNQLRGVYYNRTDINTEANQIGLIAQETESVVPEVVHTANDELGTKSISYGQLNALLVEAIKEQQTIIDNLKSRIETLENQ